MHRCHCLFWRCRFTPNPQHLQSPTTSLYQTLTVASMGDVLRNSMAAFLFARKSRSCAQAAQADLVTLNLVRKPSIRQTCRRELSMALSLTLPKPLYPSPFVGCLIWYIRHIRNTVMHPKSGQGIGVQVHVKRKRATV